LISSDLINVAEALADSPAKGNLKQGYRRRAISTAYYALFHALADLCANELVGSRKTKSDAWRRTYRALEHGPAKAALLELSRRNNDPSLARLSEAFVALQQFRHDADYDPHQRYAVGSDGPCIVIAQMGIDAAAKLSADIRMELATSLLLRTRR
jgi:hypothetical protein